MINTQTNKKPLIKLELKASSDLKEHLFIVINSIITPRGFYLNIFDPETEA